MMNPNSSKNDAVAASLTHAWARTQERTLTQTMVWEAFLYFYNEMDKHNCPVKDQKPLNSWFYDLNPVGPPTPNYQQQQMPQLTPAKTLPQPTWKNALSEFEAAR